jgi:hypothetical protein
MPGPIVNGKDFNYFQEVNIATASFPTEPQVQIAFRGAQRLTFILESGTNVEYSFNGNTVHGNMKTGISNNLNFDIRNNKLIWFRCSGGATVRVEAWHIGV